MIHADSKSIIIKINEMQTVSIYFHFIGDTISIDLTFIQTSQSSHKICSF